MTEEQKDANQEEVETSADSSEAQNEQEANESELAQTQPSDGKTWQEKYEDMVAALREERKKTKGLKQSQPQIQSVQQPSQLTAQPDENVAAQMIMRANADAYIAKKVVTDPIFRDIAPEIEAKVAQGYDVMTAEAIVKSEMFDRLIQEGRNTKSEEPIIRPKTLEPTATPEPRKPQSTGNVLDDVESGFKNVPPEMAEAIRRIRR